jgi:Ca2+-binding RTX toxin-like protein
LRLYSAGLYCAIYELAFDNGTVLTHAQLMAAMAVATTGDDYVYGDDLANTIAGQAGDDVIYGRAGNDTLTGGAGNDTLIGNAGNDAYVSASGDGNDTIRDAGSSADLDILQLSGPNAADITLVRPFASMNDLQVLITATGERITVTDHFLDNARGLERILFADGTFWDRTAMLAALGNLHADDFRLL